METQLQQRWRLHFACVPPLNLDTLSNQHWSSVWSLPACKNSLTLDSSLLQWLPDWSPQVLNSSLEVTEQKVFLIHRTDSCQVYITIISTTGLQPYVLTSLRWHTKYRSLTVCAPYDRIKQLSHKQLIIKFLISPVRYPIYHLNFSRKYSQYFVMLEILGHTVTNN